MACGLLDAFCERLRTNCSISRVVPIADNTAPDVQKVRHIPAWMFRGAKDEQHLVQNDRALAQQLKEAGAEVRYTEFPDRGHMVWHVYDRKELYDWLKEKVRR